MSENCIKKLFDQNREWVSHVNATDPTFFEKTQDTQKPRYFWVGCSDSRVPAEQILGLKPGELFVHRNVANLFPHTDMNCLSVLEFAVRYLRVEHVIVCGHYNCGGVLASMSHEPHGLVDNWLRHIRDVAADAHQELELLSEQEKSKRLVELNVQQQALNVCHTTIIQEAWRNGQPITVHGWVYDLANGLLKKITNPVSSSQEIHSAYQTF